MIDNRDALDRAAQELAAEIDRVVLDNARLTMLDNLDWTIVPRVIGDADRIAEILAWVHQNATGNYTYFDRRLVFEREVDATAYLLKWR